MTTYASDSPEPIPTRRSSDEPIDRNRGMRGLTSGLGWRPDPESDHLYPPHWTPKGTH